MTTINLKDIYYWYTQDQLIEVSDEVAEVFKADARYEMAYQRRRSRHQRHVRCLDSARGEIHAGRRLGRARHADDDHIGAGEIVAVDAVIVAQGVLHRLDATIVVLVKGVTGTVVVLHRRFGVLGQPGDQRLERKLERDMQPAAAFFEGLTHIAVTDAVQQETVSTGQFAEDFRNLVEAPHHLPQAALDFDTFELRQRVARQHLDQLARCVRDEVHDDCPAHGTLTGDSRRRAAARCH